jgi:hypothetical protein
VARKKTVDVDALLKEHLRQLGAKGGRQTAKNLSKEERAEKARQAAKARWKDKPAKKATRKKPGRAEGSVSGQP